MRKIIDICFIVSFILLGLFGIVYCTHQILFFAFFLPETPLYNFLDILALIEDILFYCSFPPFIITIILMIVFRKYYE